MNGRQKAEPTDARKPGVDDNKVDDGTKKGRPQVDRPQTKTLLCCFTICHYLASSYSEIRITLDDTVDINIHPQTCDNINDAGIYTG